MKSYYTKRNKKGKQKKNKIKYKNTKTQFSLELCVTSSTFSYT